MQCPERPTHIPTRPPCTAPAALPCSTVIEHVAARYPRSRLLAAGWSLGANILLRYLGEEGQAGRATPLAAAVSMCNPFNLTISNKVGHNASALAR